MTLVFRGRAVFAALLAALALAGATGANAAIITSHDDQGRTITFDVRAPVVDTEWYASVLRAAAHGNEISNVTITIVPEPQIPAFCGGQDAAACYSRNGPTIYVPAGKSRLLETILLHEYGHHLDTVWHVPGVPELNGTPTWWADRGMASLLASNQVAFDYSLGWSHSIGEVFAEDYAYIHTHSRYGITWLSPPDAALQRDMFTELGTPTATISKANRKGVRARAQLVCNETVVVTRTFRKGQARRTFDIPNLGPATCDVRLVSSVATTLSYTLHISLAVEST